MSSTVLSAGQERRSSTVVWLQRGAVAAIWISVIVAWQIHQSSNGLSATETAQRFIDTVGASWWGVFAYVLVYLARPIVLFPASILTIVGGILFGPVVGVLVVVIAANASAMIAYGVGRLLGRPPGAHDETDDTTSFVRRWSNRMREHSFETVLIMRLLFLPYDLVNYVSGILRLRWLPFLLATALGSLPGTVSFVLLGASIDRVDEGLGGIDPAILVASVVIFVVSLVLARLLRRRQPPTTAAGSIRACDAGDATPEGALP
jgi:uncharacterized membrane protein YdjX (TVP38/TMEM64 family)